MHHQCCKPAICTAAKCLQVERHFRPSNPPRPHPAAAADSRGVTPRTILLRHLACEVGLMPLDALLGSARK